MFKRSTQYAVLFLILISGPVFATAQSRATVSNYGVPRAVNINNFVRRTIQPSYGRQEWNLLLTEGFYPIGWSRDGKFAYYVEPADEACGCYFAELRIQDLRTDKVLWEFKNDPESRVDAKGEIIADDIRKLWKRNQKLFDEKLREHGIVPAARSILLGSTFNSAGRRYTAKVTTRKAHEEGFGLDMVRAVKLELSSPALGKKDLHSTDYKTETYPPLDIGVAGALKSPFENRAAIVMIKVQRGWEGPPHTVEVQIAGADLVNGFQR
jgi:hypothetical protein